MTPEERDIYWGKKKKALKYLVKFIGELFSNQFLPSMVIKICSKTLLEKFFDRESIEKDM